MQVSQSLQGFSIKHPFLNILIDIGHPADFHLFRNYAKEMQSRGHTILFTARQKEFEKELLKSYGFNYQCFGRPFKSAPGKVWGMAYFSFRMLLVALKFKPDQFVSHGSFYACLVSVLLRKPHISTEDTGNMEQVRLYRPLTNVILVPHSFHLELGKKQLRYPGNHELAYLHPRRFQPDPSIRKALGMEEGQPYVLLRFVGWHASHDMGHRGLSEASKLKAVQEFSRYARVFISSEKPLSPELAPFRLPLPPEKIHDVIAFSSMVYGESATMASEAAVLGVPAIYLDNTGRCYTREEEKKYGLVFNFTESLHDQEESIRKGCILLRSLPYGNVWQEKRNLLLSEMMDVTAFLCWFSEQWPQSDKICRQDDYRFTEFISR